MSGVAGLRGTGDWSTDERPKDFRSKILQVRPNGNAPIFALTSRAKKRSVSDPEFNWWAESENIIRLKVSGAHAAADTLITVDSADPTGSTMSVPYGTATHLKPGDLLLAEPVSDSATYDHELIAVEVVLSDTQFTVTRGVGGTSAVSLSDDRFLTKIGSAYAEGTAAPRAVSRNPVKFFNYCQIFKNTYELTGTAGQTEVRTGDPWSRDKKRKTFDHARDIEMSILFGRKHETTGSNGKPQRYMGGLREFIPSSNTTVFSSAVSSGSFMDAINPVFKMDLGGGDTRIGFCGNHARIELGKVIQAATGIKMELGKVITMWGIDFQELVLPLGRVLLKTHPLLSMHDLYKKSMFLLDFETIEYIYLRGRDTKTKDDVQADDEDLRRGFIQTECSLLVDGGGVTQGYLGNISST